MKEGFGFYSNGVALGDLFPRELQMLRRDWMALSTSLAVCAGHALAAKMLPNESSRIFLLGDSVFDNKRYVGKGPAVIDEVQREFGQNWDVELLAVDGAVVSEVGQQWAGKDLEKAFVFLSVGGNDALKSIGILDRRVSNASQVFDELADLRETFATKFHQVVASICETKAMLTLCTIYDPQFREGKLSRRAVTALSVFNDVITREAFGAGLPLMDLRLAFSKPDYYANPIEPSSRGAELLAKMMKKVVSDHVFTDSQSRIFVKT